MPYHPVDYASEMYYKLLFSEVIFMWLRRSFITTGYNCSTNTARNQNICGEMWSDVNNKKGSNVIGKDTFSFIVLKSCIIPIRRDDCYIGNNGWGCSWYIL